MARARARRSLKKKKAFFSLAFGQTNARKSATHA
jgi:hypothetical protein